MYLIIASDGRTYGPVSAQEIRSWVASNRANAQTLAQLEGSTEWKPLGSYPEFADLFSGPPPVYGQPAYTASSSYNGAQDRVTIDVDQEASRINASAKALDIGSCFSRSWAVLTANFWLVVGATFVVELINAAIGILYGVLIGGLFLLMLRLVRKEKTEFGDAFAGFSICFLPLFLCGLVAGILTFAGFLCCVLPFFYLLLAWKFSLLLVMDQRLDFWPAMMLSMKVVNKRFGDILLLGLVAFLINIVGGLCCYVGIFVSIPLTLLMTAYAYEDIFGPTRRAA